MNWALWPRRLRREVPGETDRRRAAVARKALDTTATAAVLVAAVVVTWKTLTVPSRLAADQPALRIPTEPLGLPAPTLVEGDPRAPVVLFEYSDFQCAYCGKFARETLPALRREYVDSGRLRIAFRHFPAIGRESAEKAASVSMCAASRGRFWEVHDRLFAGASPLGRGTIEDVAGTLGLSVKDLASCEAAASKTLKEDVEHARTLGIRVTPTFLFGTGDGSSVTVRSGFTGAQPLAEFVKAIEGVLAHGGQAKMRASRR